MGLGIVGDLITGGISNMWADERQEDAQQFSAGQTAAQMAFQERMRATQYQTAVADMKAAGLNPMLAYHQGGAGTPTGAAASSSPASGASFHSIQANLQSAAQIENIDALTDRAKAERDKIRAEETEIKARTPTHAVSIDQMRQQIEQSKTLIEKMIQETKTSAASAANLHQQTINLKELVPQIKATVAQLRAQVDLTKAETKQAEAKTGLSEAQTDEIRQRITQNLPEIERAIKNLEEKALYLQMPRRGMEAAANDSFIGALGAVLRTLNPLSSLLNSTR